MKKIVFTGGGTAGHVMPNVALFPYFYDCEIHYIGSCGGMEKKLLASERIIYHEIPCVKLVRGFAPENLLIPQKFSVSVSNAKSLLCAISPDVIFSKGGFVGLPSAFAKKKDTPLVLHESDISMGLANRLAYGKCDKLLCSFDAIKRKKAIFTGSPIRKKIYMGSREAGLKRSGLQDNGKPFLLVFGGSSGAKAINEAVLLSREKICEKFNVLHIVGKGNKQGIAAPGYREIEFTDAIEDYYSLADYALSRGGANSLLELTALGKPTLCIPLCNKKSRGDQVENARYFEEKGCIDVISEADVLKGNLVRALNELVKNEKVLRGNMRAQNCFDGTEIIAKIVRSYL